MSQGISRSGGGETALNQRNPDLYETILSGDIGIANDSSDNAYHVVTADNVDDLSSRLNGFTIRDGYRSLVSPLSLTSYVSG